MEKKNSIDTSTGESAGKTLVEPVDDVENNQQPKLPYPKRVFFINSNEFCERFTYYGMKAILVLYMQQKLHKSEDDAVVLYHAFSMMVYFMCTFGAILSDVWLGKYKTILILSVVYAIGGIIVTVGSIPTVPIPANVSLYIGLVLIAFGSGGIKPCVAAFGGDQFKMPEQAAHVATYFSLFYFSINSGSLLSTFISPVLRADVHCFGDEDCYPLAFGVPVILMITSIVVFLFGKPLYTIVKISSKNMIVEVSKCISTAIKTKRREKKTNPREHFLDYATDKCGEKLVNDTKVLLKILVLYLPLPLFWALYDQQGSRWTFQANRMSSDIGFYEIKPDQMQTFNPFLILVFIPLYDSIFYPLLSKVGIRRPLQKLTAGGILAGVAFILSALVEFELEKTYPVLPQAGEAQLRYYNGFPCDYSAAIDDSSADSFTLKALNAYEQKHIAFNGERNLTYDFTRIGSNNNCPNFIKSHVSLNETAAWSVFVTNDELDAFLINPDKPPEGTPMYRFLYASNDDGDHQIWLQNDQQVVLNNESVTNREEHAVPSGKYQIFLDAQSIRDLVLKQGGVYTVIVHRESNGAVSLKTKEVVSPNSFSILWQIPQYFVMTLGEVMFSVTGLAFSYAQAPKSMKSVLQACWLLAVAFGNLIDMVIVKMHLFDSRAFEFLFFSSLMFIDMILFMYLAYRYKGNDHSISNETLPLDKKDGDEDSTQL